MTTASLCIALNITVITNNCIYESKIGNIISVASRYDVINLQGETSTKKYNKYLSLLIANGFKIINTKWIKENEIAQGATCFNIELSK